MTPLSKGDAYVEPPAGVRFLRSGEITVEGAVTAESDVHISDFIHNGLMKRSQLDRGDLLIAIVGATIGSAGIYDCDESANINQAIAAVRLRKGDVSREFACWYLHSSLGQKLLDYFKRPVARANINLEEVGEIPLLVPGVKQQREMVSAMNAARAERQAKLAEADALLVGLDGFLLATLGLTPPPKEECKVYAIRANELRRRIDAYSNQARFRNLFTYIQNTRHPVATFEQLATVIFSGATPLAKGDAYVEPPEGVRFIRSGEITSDGEVTTTSEVHLASAIHDGPMKRSRLQRGDLLIAIVGATIGAAGIFNRDEPANINQAIAVVRLAGKDISPEFACLYLRSCIGQAFLDYFKRPVARANINLEEIGEIPVLVPHADLQQAIVAESHRRRDEARLVRTEAEAGWQAAKHRFEEQLLGPAQP